MKNRLVILGAGESGVGAALLAKQKEFDVFVSDSGFIAPAHKEELVSHAIDFEEGAHTKEKILNAVRALLFSGIRAIVNSVPNKIFLLLHWLLRE